VRFLLTRRWILFLLAVVVLALACVRLGEWQFHRLHDREQRNAWAERNMSAAPAPIDQVLAVGAVVPQSREWRQVTVSGTYDAGETVVVRYQTRDGQSGVDLVTPLRTDAGPAVLVDRGWVQTENTGTRPEDLPQPPQGKVEVVGWVRVDATGDSTQVDDRSTRAISSEAIGAGLPYPVYGGFVDAEKETPPAADPLVPVEKPDLGNGPHLFYGIQWWFFGALALFGFCYLVYDERKRARTGSPRAGTGTRHVTRT
jgi:cytochrome oxidase assembly protein ShyY1